MQSKRDGLIPIGEALADLDGPVQAIRKTPPPARRSFKKELQDAQRRQRDNLQKQIRRSQARVTTLCVCLWRTRKTTWLS